MHLQPLSSTSIFNLQFISMSILTCRYRLAMLLNEIAVSEKSLGQLKMVTTNMQIMTLFELKRITKSCLVQNYSYTVQSQIVMFVSFTSTELFNKCDVSYVLQYKLRIYFNIFIFYLLDIFNEIVSHHCLLPIYHIDLYSLMGVMYIYIHIVP